MTDASTRYGSLRFNCEVCNTEFRRSPRDVKRGHTRFCSRKCFVSGYSPTEVTRQKISAGHTGRKHGALQRDRIRLALTGKRREKKWTGSCGLCGNTFASGAPNAKFCSRVCARAASGHGRVHHPDYASKPKECAICKATSRLVGDHDHRTGESRGILCRHCNLAIGIMMDNPDLLRAAASYLEGF